MECYSCDLSGVCKIFQIINDSKLVVKATITDCKAKRKWSGDTYTPTAVEPAPEEIRQRTPLEIMSVSERIKELTNKKTASNPSTEPLDKKEECPSCGSKDGEAVKCSNCETLVCYNCCVESIRDDRVYCQECWDTL